MHLIDRTQQVSTDAVWTALSIWYRDHHNLGSVYLSFFNRLRQVIVSGYEVEHIRCRIPCMVHQIQTDPQINSLLLATHPESAKPQLHFGEFTDSLLLRIRNAVFCRVVPADSQQWQTRQLGRSSRQNIDQLGVLHVDATAKRVPVARVAAEARR